MKRPNFDSYYDPPEVDETCVICNKDPWKCTCPECPKCGVTGDPKCEINKKAVQSEKLRLRLFQQVIDSDLYGVINNEE